MVMSKDDSLAALLRMEIIVPKVQCPILFFSLDSLFCLKHGYRIHGAVQLPPWMHLPMCATVEVFEAANTCLLMAIGRPCLLVTCQSYLLPKDRHQGPFNHIPYHLAHDSHCVLAESFMK